MNDLIIEYVVFATLTNKASRSFLKRTKKRFETYSYSIGALFFRKLTAMMNALANCWRYTLKTREIHLAICGKILANFGGTNDHT